MDGVRSCRLALVLLSAMASGCLVPVRHRTLLRPEGTVVVLDAATGRPLAGAGVVLRRYNLGPPPSRESRRDVTVTDEKGRASFTLLTGHEWVMPLMMHGVPEWAFDVCADAPGHDGAPHSWIIQGMSTSDADLGPQPTLTIALAPGSKSCEENPAWRAFITHLITRPPAPAR